MWAVTSDQVEATAVGFRSYRSFFRTVATPNGAISKFSLSKDRIRLTGLESSHMVK